MDEPIELPEYGMRDLFLPGDTPRIALARLRAMKAGADETLSERIDDAIQWLVQSHTLEEGE